MGKIGEIGKIEEIDTLYKGEIGRIRKPIF